jgi:hypothetical protein
MASYFGRSCHFSNAQVTETTFSVILIYCDPSDPLKLWNTFKKSMVEDFIHRRMQVSDVEQAVLAHIYRVISQHGKTLTTFNLPQLHQVIAE